MSHSHLYWEMTLSKVHFRPKIPPLVSDAAEDCTCFGSDQSAADGHSHGACLTYTDTTDVLRLSPLVGFFCCVLLLQDVACDIQQSWEKKNPLVCFWFILCVRRGGQMYGQQHRAASFKPRPPPMTTICSCIKYVCMGRDCDMWYAASSNIHSHMAPCQRLHLLRLKNYRRFIPSGLNKGISVVSQVDCSLFCSFICTSLLLDKLCCLLEGQFSIFFFFFLLSQIKM